MRPSIVESLEELEHSINQNNHVIRFQAENNEGTHEDIITISQITMKKR